MTVVEESEGLVWVDHDLQTPWQCRACQRWAMTTCAWIFSSTSPVPNHSAIPIADADVAMPMPMPERASISLRNDVPRQ